ncbi:MAG: FKBP-type peptidyl-prolyl cis-trans isomerase [Chlamydiia bacterium]
MRATIFGLNLFFSSIFFGFAETKNFTEKLSSEQRELLDEFFHILIRDSFSGYVLYGDKPICIEGCLNDEFIEMPSEYDKKLATLTKGINFWENLNLSVQDKNFFFLIRPFHEYRHLICINKDAFIRAVNQNLSLFRYVLGPNLTAESLLNQLIQTNNNFYDVLRDDNVLLGILLGYGTQNALTVSRKEKIENAFFYDCIEDFPFISRRDRMAKEVLPKMQIERPSLGFTTLYNETKSLKTTVVSRKLHPFDSTKIPYFGCEPDSEETKFLLDTYVKNRAIILQALESENFLEKTLEKFFLTNSGELDLPMAPPHEPVILPENKEELLAQIICSDMRKQPFFRGSFITDFIDGVIAQENSQEKVSLTKPELASIWEEYYLKKDLKSCENLGKTESYFASLSSKKELTSVIPGKVYSQSLLAGTGSPTSRKLSKVSIHYSFSVPECIDVDLNEATLRAGTLVDEDFGLLIPGVAHTLIGMRKGEKRQVYLHPEYAYGEESYLPPNIPIIAEIELIDFVEGDQEIAFAPLQQLTEKNLEEVRAKLTTIYKKQFYEQGIEFCDHYKSVIDIPSFKKAFIEANQKEICIQNRGKFLVDLDFVSKKWS